MREKRVLLTQFKLPNLLTPTQIVPILFMALTSLWP